MHEVQREVPADAACGEVHPLRQQRHSDRPRGLGEEVPGDVAQHLCDLRDNGVHEAAGRGALHADRVDLRRAPGEAARARGFYVEGPEAVPGSGLRPAGPAAIKLITFEVQEVQARVLPSGQR